MREKYLPSTVRLDAAQRAQIRALADQARLPDAELIRGLIGAGIEARTQSDTSPAPSGNDEIQLHLLVAIEQVLALIESFLPEGPGAARGVLPAAVRAARDRLDGAEEQGLE